MIAIVAWPSISCTIRGCVPWCRCSVAAVCRRSFLSLCRAWSRCERAHLRFNEVLRKRVSVTSDYLDLVRKCEVSIERSEHTLRQLWDSFGMTPSARSRLDVYTPPPENEEDDFARRYDRSVTRRHVKEIRLWDVSPTFLPAQSLAVVAGVKSRGGEVDGLQARRLTRCGCTTDKGSGDHRWLLRER